MTEQEKQDNVGSGEGQSEIFPEPEITFTCVHKSMTLLLNDNCGSVKFNHGIYVATGGDHILAVREAILSSGHKGKFNVVSKAGAAGIIANHKAAMDAVAITGAVGSQSDKVQGPAARLQVEAQMRDAGVDIDTEAAKAVLDAVSPPVDQPVSDKDLQTEATGIVAMGEAASATPEDSKGGFFTKKD